MPVRSTAKDNELPVYPFRPKVPRARRTIIHVRVWFEFRHARRARCVFTRPTHVALPLPVVTVASSKTDLCAAATAEFIAGWFRVVLESTAGGVPLCGLSNRLYDENVWKRQRFKRFGSFFRRRLTENPAIKPFVFTEVPVF